MPQISVNDLKNGITLELDNGLFQVVEFQHVKPGKGGAFVRSKLRNVLPPESVRNNKRRNAVKRGKRNARRVNGHNKRRDLPKRRKWLQLPWRDVFREHVATFMDTGKFVQVCDGACDPN